MKSESRLKAIEWVIGKFRSKALPFEVPIQEEQLQKERAFRREFLAMLEKDVSDCGLVEPGPLFDKEIPALTQRLREVAVLRVKLRAAATFLRTNVARRMDDGTTDGEMILQMCDSDFEGRTDEMILTAKLALETLLLSANIAKVSHALLLSAKITDTQAAVETCADKIASALEQKDRYAEISLEKWLIYGDIEAEVRCLSREHNDRYTVQ
jgi:hypothetical protein